MEISVGPNTITNNLQVCASERVYGNCQEVDQRIDKDVWRGTALVVHCLRLHAPNAGSLGLIPCQATRSHVLQLRIQMQAATEDFTYRS